MTLITCWVVMLLVTIADSSLTCDSQCESQADSENQHETFGPTSRCFKVENNEVSHRCYRVDCQSGKYRVLFPAGAKSEWFENSASGKSGELVLEPLWEVCDTSGKVLRSYDETMKNKVKKHLEEEYSDDFKQLWGHYVNGKLIMHTAEEHMVKNRYIFTTKCALNTETLNALEGQIEELKHVAMYQLATRSTEDVLTAMKDPCIAMMEQDVRIQRFDSVNTSAEGIDSVDDILDGRLTTRYTGVGVDVYHMDSGVDASHVLFDDRVKPGMDFTGRGNPHNDMDGHGSHTAGTVVARDVGMAPGANLIPIKVFCDSCFCGRRCQSDFFESASSNLVRAANYVIESTRISGRPSVVSASLGSPLLHRTVNAAFTRMVNAGIPVVVAVGNDNTMFNNISPASADGVLRIGALDARNNTNTAALFSNFGPQLDLWAPGVDILSVASGSGSGLTRKRGTSMACPHVTGAVALLLERNPSMTPAEVRNELLNNCNTDLGTLKSSPGKILRIARQDGQGSCPLQATANDPTDDPIPDSSFRPGIISSILGMALLVVFLC